MLWSCRQTVLVLYYGKTLIWHVCLRGKIQCVFNSLCKIPNNYFNWRLTATIPAPRQTYIQTDRQTGRQTDRQTDRHIHTHTHRHRHKHRHTVRKTTAIDRVCLNGSLQTQTQIQIQTRTQTHTVRKTTAIERNWIYIYIIKLYIRININAGTIAHLYTYHI